MKKEMSHAVGAITRLTPKLAFRSLTSTKDGKLTKGRVYNGHVVTTTIGLRVACYDNLGVWQTFDPKVFMAMGVS